MSDQGELLTGEQIKAAKQHTERMSRAVDIAAACVQRVAWGEHGPNGPTMDQAAEAVEHPLQGMPSADLRLVVAALAARVDRLQSGVDKRAVRGLESVRRALALFDEETARRSA